jgi:hypothetical protein
MPEVTTVPAKYVFLDVVGFTQKLGSAREFFEGGGRRPSEFHAHFITSAGQQRLRKDWPDIWREFGLDAYSNIDQQ